MESNSENNKKVLIGKLGEDRGEDDRKCTHNSDCVHDSPNLYTGCPNSR